AELKGSSKVPSGSGAAESTLQYQCLASKVRVLATPPRAPALIARPHWPDGSKPGVEFLGLKLFSPGREHPLRTRFANFSYAGRESEKQISMAPQATRSGQLGDWDLRDNFAQPSDSPNHCIEPVWRAINGAVPLAAEGHHFALELIEAVTM